ncbi:MAG: hypothetical protein SFU56_06250 [Capsulimonadales bacterium]|nr:hypothetical protein [Capsulimonadales bacterium]
MSVQGTVRLTNGAPARFAAVWLEGGPPATPLKNARIDQREKTFVPHVLFVTPGTRVEFPNSDTVFHNVFAFFEAKRFDLGLYPRGTSRGETFQKPGIVAVLCNIHPKMSAFIVVADSRYHDVAAENGRFALASVPPGKYVLRAWHESGAVVRQSLTVTAGMPTPDLQLRNR